MTAQAIRLHAVTHLAGGSDPLPGVPWVYLDIATSISVANDNAKHYLSIQATPDFTHGGHFYTNDPDTFQNASHTSAGTPYYGLQISEPGTFLFMLDGHFEALSGGSHGELNFDIFSGGGVGPAGSQWQFGRLAVNGSDTWDQQIPNHISFMQLIAVQGNQDSLDGNSSNIAGTPATGNDNLPSVVLLWAQHNSSSSTNVQAGMVALKLGPGVFYPGSWS